MGIDGVRRALSCLRGRGCGWGVRQTGACQRRSRLRSPSILLLEVRPVPLAVLVARRNGAAGRVQPRPHLGDRWALASPGARWWSDARGTLRGNELEGAAGLVGQA